ncbi:MAG: hypothetical protein LUQ71_09165, partial [Methanoregula sp.]|nr:hypothetical protein [Methanoregula sp.]
MECHRSTRHANPRSSAARPQERAGKRLGRLTVILLLLTAILLMFAPAAGAVPSAPASGNATSPQVIKIGVDIVDFNDFSVADGTAETNFYLSLRSDTPVDLNNVELMNGQITAVYSFVNTT